MTTDAENQVTLVRVLNAPRAKVWRALAEPAALAQWWGLPDRAAMPVCKLDFRVGGMLHCQITHDGAAFWFKWIYREVVEGEWLVMEQHFSDADGRDCDSAARPVSTITVRLEDLEGKTKLMVTQAGMASDVHPAEAYKQGWTESLGRLVKTLDRF